MSSNPSIDFLEMLKAGAPKPTGTSSPRKTSKDNNSVADNKNSKITTERVDRKNHSVQECSKIAVIDTETNWRDQVMSIGVAIADAKTFKCEDTLYYIIDPEYRSGGMYSSVLHYHRNRALSGLHNQADSGSSDGILDPVKENVSSRRVALNSIKEALQNAGITKIFAYNGKFDLGHLEELNCFEWYDIMRLAAYKQYNKAIDDSFTCCKTGRLKTNYGVEPITRMLSGNQRYCEIHNAVYDAVDELRIIELLGHEIEKYEVARIN